jgi:tetratricopeptide (TPR) repeat protein
MKRVAVILGILSLAGATVASAATQTAQQSPAASSQSTSSQTPAQGQGQSAGQGAGQSAGQSAAQSATPGTAAAPGTKRPPQAKTQPEFDAYKTAAGNTDPAALEKAADDFATKFPDSELRVLLYKNTMRLYQSANNADKTEAMGRKVLTFDGDDPEALVIVAEVIAEKTRESDIDKDQRFGEATAMAQKATQTIETDVQVPAGTPQEKIDAYKAMMRSQAYSIIGTIDFKKENFPSAEQNLQKSIDAYPSDPDKVVILRLALTLDKEQKYPEALKVANRAVEMTQDNTPIGTPARHERDRLQQLTGGAAPAQSQTPPKN